MLLFSSSIRTTAQIVPPVNSDIHVASVVPQLPWRDDITVNCDMFSVPGQQLPLRVIVWDEGSCIDKLPPFNPPTVGNVHVYVEDPMGNTAITSFQGAHPDVVLGDDPQNPGKQTYWMLIPFVDGNMNYQLRRLVIKNVGTPGLSVTVAGGPMALMLPAGGQSYEYPLYDTRALPHIDAWAEAPGTAPGGLCAINRYVVTYDDSLQIYYQTGNLATGSPGAGILLGSGHHPDVAAQIDIKSGTAYAHFTYNLGTTTPTVGLGVLELPMGSGASTFYNLTPYNAFYPRIEAMSRWSPMDKMARWQVVTSETRPAPLHHFQSYGYNDLHPNNTPPNNPYLSSLFPLNDHKSNAVAAGVGRSMGGGIGNLQYTAGYLSWDTNANTQNYMFVRSIDGSTGIATAPYYQVNVNPIPGSPTYAEIDASKGLALSSCSNSGNYILAAWYDGVSEIYEKLTPISNIQFRPTGIADPDSHTTQLYPNPACSELRLTTSGHYDIYGIDGRQLQSGDAEADHPIHIGQLPAGSYILKLQSTSETRAFPFVKP